MSRLERHIRQKIAQRDYLDLAALELAGRPGQPRVPGVVIEFGFGAGRSYSHLAARFPDREIFCFDRDVRERSRERPPADRFFEGEFEAVLAPGAALHRRFAGGVALLHIDVGALGPEDEVIPELILSRVHPWLGPGALVVSDQHLTLEPVWRLAAVDPGPRVQHAELFYLYRRPA
jgi:hypothetical protein